jgi:predicted RNase H-like HicB family nuclease
MKNYIALVEGGDSRHAHGVSFPDLPGVFSAADDERDITANAIEALQLWAEDADMPEPSSLAEIAARADIRTSLSTGKFYLMAIPFIENDAAVVRANVTFERGLLRAIDEEAIGRGLTRAGFLAQAARHEIERAPSRLAGKRSSGSGSRKIAASALTQRLDKRAAKSSVAAKRSASVIATGMRSAASKRRKNKP